MVAGAVAGVAAIGTVDFLTGVEYRIFPLYFLPLSLAAWYLGRAGALAAAALATTAWAGSNWAAGLQFAHPGVWLVNLLAQAVSFVVVALLIAGVRGALDRVTELSLTDALTSLPNARAFRQQAEQTLALAKRYEHPITLAFIDLDDFKAVNDTLGHQGGDRLLREVAEQVRQSVRAGDLPARLGGDEFVVLLPETGPEGARKMLDRLHARLGEALGRSPWRVTASVGAVSFAAPEGQIDDLVREADLRMYRAKAAGKNRLWLEVVGPPAAAVEPPGSPIKTTVGTASVPTVTNGETDA